MSEGAPQPASPGELHLASSSKRIPELDGLRGLAILMVIICHYIANASHAPLGFVGNHLLTILDVGWSGVDLFFVLSGFLIGGILLESRASRNYFKTFYLRRAHRILPIYYLWILLYIAFLCAAVYLIPNPVLLSPPGKALAAQDISAFPKYVFFLQNIFYSPRVFEWIWFIVTWSLAVEEQFYLVAPPLIRFLSRRTLIITLSLTVCVAPILRWFCFRYLPQLDHFYQFGMPCRADALSLGILAALGWRWVPFQKFLKDHPVVLQRIVVYLGVILVGLLWWLARPPNVVTVTIGYSVLAFFFVALLLLVLSQTGAFPARLMRATWLRRLGTISYCVYIIHLTVNQLLHRFLLHAEPSITDWRGILLTLSALGLTLLVASVSWRYFEKPLFRRGHKFSY